MGKEAIEGIISVATAIIGVAIVATLVSKNATTSNVILSGGTALSTALSAAEGPVTQTSGSSLSNLSTGWTGSAPVDLGTY